MTFEVICLILLPKCLGMSCLVDICHLRLTPLSIEVILIVIFVVYTEILNVLPADKSSQRANDVIDDQGRLRHILHLHIHCFPQR